MGNQQLKGDSLDVWHSTRIGVRDTLNEYVGKWVDRSFARASYTPVDPVLCRFNPHYTP